MNNEFGQRLSPLATQVPEHILKLPANDFRRIIGHTPLV